MLRLTLARALPDGGGKRGTEGSGSHPRAPGRTAGGNSKKRTRSCAPARGRGEGESRGGGRGGPGGPGPGGGPAARAAGAGRRGGGAGMGRGAGGGALGRLRAEAERHAAEVGSKVEGVVADVLQAAQGLELREARGAATEANEETPESSGALGHGVQVSGALEEAGLRAEEAEYVRYVLGFLYGEQAEGQLSATQDEAEAAPPSAGAESKPPDDAKDSTLGAEVPPSMAALDGDGEEQDAGLAEESVQEISAGPSGRDAPEPAQVEKADVSVSEQISRVAERFQQALTSLSELAGKGQPTAAEEAVQALSTSTSTELAGGDLPKFEADFDQDLVIIGENGTDESLALDTESSGGENVEGILPDEWKDGVGRAGPFFEPKPRQPVRRSAGPKTQEAVVQTSFEGSQYPEHAKISAEVPSGRTPGDSDDPSESAFLSRLLSDKALAREKPTLDAVEAAPKHDDAAAEYLAALQLEKGRADVVSRALAQDDARKSPFLKDGFDYFSAMERADEFVKDIESLRLSELVRSRRKDISMPDIAFDSLEARPSVSSNCADSNYVEYYTAAAMIEPDMLGAMAAEVARRAITGVVAKNEVDQGQAILRQHQSKQLRQQHAKTTSGGQNKRSVRKVAAKGGIAPGRGAKEPKSTPLENLRHVKRYGETKSAISPAPEISQRHPAATVTRRKKAEVPSLQVIKTFSGLPQPKKSSQKAGSEKLGPRSDAEIGSKPQKTKFEKDAEAKDMTLKAANMTDTSGHVRQPLSQILPRELRVRRAAAATQTSETTEKKLKNLERPPQESTACQTDNQEVSNAEASDGDADALEKILVYPPMGDLSDRSTNDEATFMHPSNSGSVIVAGTQFMKASKEKMKISTPDLSKTTSTTTRTVSANPHTIHKFVSSELVDAVVADILVSRPYDDTSADETCKGQVSAHAQIPGRVVERTVIGHVDAVLSSVLADVQAIAADTTAAAGAVEGDERCVVDEAAFWAGTGPVVERADEAKDSHPAQLSSLPNHPQASPEMPEVHEDYEGAIGALELDRTASEERSPKPADATPIELEQTPSPLGPRVRENIVPEARNPPIQSLRFEDGNPSAPVREFQREPPLDPRIQGRSADQTSLHTLASRNKTVQPIDWGSAASSSSSEDEGDEAAWNEPVASLKWNVREVRESDYLRPLHSGKRAEKDLGPIGVDFPPIPDPPSTPKMTVSILAPAESDAEITEEQHQIDTQAFAKELDEAPGLALPLDEGKPVKELVLPATSKEPDVPVDFWLSSDEASSGYWDGDVSGSMTDGVDCSLTEPAQTAESA